jgi:hypothetical protein
VIAKIENATFAEYSCPIRLIFCWAVPKSFKNNSAAYKKNTQALVSFKKYMPPPLPYFKVNIWPLPLPHFTSIFFAYL